MITTWTPRGSRGTPRLLREPSPDGLLTGRSRSPDRSDRSGGGGSSCLPDPCGPVRKTLPSPPRRDLRATGGRGSGPRQDRPGVPPTSGSAQRRPKIVETVNRRSAGGAVADVRRFTRCTGPATERGPRRGTAKDAMDQRRARATTLAAVTLPLLVACGPGADASDGPGPPPRAAAALRRPRPSAGTSADRAAASPTPSPDADVAAQEEQVRAATTTFVRTVLTIGYPDRTYRQYTDRIEPLDDRERLRGPAERRLDHARVPTPSPPSTPSAPGRPHGSRARSRSPRCRATGRRPSSRTRTSPSAGTGAGGGR